MRSNGSFQEYCALWMCQSSQPKIFADNVITCDLIVLCYRDRPLNYEDFEIFLPLIATNCGIRRRVLGVGTMSSMLTVFFACVCVYQTFARPSKHTVEKRWAYIENSDPQMRSIHTDCKRIVREYSDGEMPFYEYKAKIKKCIDRQERNDIPSYEDADEFTPSFNVPPAATKRFETPNNQFQQVAPNQYGDYGYYYNQDQNVMGSLDQRGNIASPQDPPYGLPQSAQAFPPPADYNYYQQNDPQTQMTSRSDIPSYQDSLNEQTMYSTDIVKKDDIPRPDV